MNGYIQVDCKGLDLLAESAQTINGLYNDVLEAIGTGKPLFATNMVWGDVSPVSPVQIFTVQFDGYVVCTASTLQVIVTNEDSVTVVNMAPTNESKTSKKSTK